jgi:hypothetical protein
MSVYTRALFPSRREVLGASLAIGALDVALRRPRAWGDEVPISGGQLVVGQFPEPAVLNFRAEYRGAHGQYLQQDI